MKEKKYYEELIRRKRNLKTLRTILVILDILSILLLIFQIIIKDVTYCSYIILIVCNIITFSVKIEDKKSSN